MQQSTDIDQNILNVFFNLYEKDQVINLQK